jgi:tetratricopeptide (TPR) repeat protein
MTIKFDEKVDDKTNLAISLNNLAHMAQLPIGELGAAESNLRRSIEICREIKDDFRESRAHQELGLLLTCMANFVESGKELEIAMKEFIALEKQYFVVAQDWQGKNWGIRSIRSLLMSKAEDAINYAKKARERAGVMKMERDISRAEYLLGASYLLKGDFVEAEKHLTEALTRDRKINLVELEPDILLEFAKLWFQQDQKPEALKHAEEALQIADRCGYRLKQADIHNFLAEFYLDAGEVDKAREHAEKARERAECGYKPAMEKAENLLKSIELK